MVDAIRELRPFTNLGFFTFSGKDYRGNRWRAQVFFLLTLKGGAGKVPDVRSGITVGISNF